MRKLVVSLMFICGSLACVAQSQTIFPSHNPALAPSEFAVKMVVVVDEGLNIRVAPGERSPLVDGKSTLYDGDLVTCYQFRIIGDGLWCKHERGWSNARWLHVVESKEKE